MSRRDGREVTSAEAHSDLGHEGIQVAVTNRQTAMIAQEGREVTCAEAHSDLAHAGICASVTNRQTAMSRQEGREWLKGQSKMK